MADRWSKAVPATPAGKDMAAAVSEMARRVGNNAGPLDVDFDATWKDPAEATGRRVLAVWMLAAINSPGPIVDALEAESAPVRDAAARALQHWVALDPSREATYTQLLATKADFTDGQRQMMTALVHGTTRPPAAAVVDELFELLGYEKLPVRELARMQLARLDPVGAKESGYDASSDRRSAQRDAWRLSWKKRHKGKQ
ncbi:MAG TPA: hypothetical protein VGI99_08555 [Gemmataceae bacterium]